MSAIRTRSIQILFPTTQEYGQSGDLNDITEYLNRNVATAELNSAEKGSAAPKTHLYYAGRQDRSWIERDILVSVVILFNIINIP